MGILILLSHIRTLLILCWDVAFTIAAHLYTCYLQTLVLLLASHLVKQLRGVAGGRGDNRATGLH